MGPAEAFPLDLLPMITFKYGWKRCFDGDGFAR